MLERWVTMRDPASKMGVPLKRDIANGSKFKRGRAGSFHLKLGEALKKQSSSLQSSLDSQVSMQYSKVETQSTGLHKRPYKSSLKSIQTQEYTVVGSQTLGTKQKKLLKSLRIEVNKKST